MEYYENLAEMYVGEDVSPDFYGWVFPKYDHVGVGTGRGWPSGTSGCRSCPSRSRCPRRRGRTWGRPTRRSRARRPRRRTSRPGSRSTSSARGRS